MIHLGTNGTTWPYNVDAENYENQHKYCRILT